jgi:hypothetical protein
MFKQLTVWYKYKYSSQGQVWGCQNSSTGSRKLIDSLGATIFRSVIEEIDWEEVNDDNDPNHFNWDYYNKVFSNGRFPGVWNTLGYLNKRGITDGLIISFMGAPPAASPLAAKDPKRS